MILLEAGINEIVVTLTEKATLTNPAYIFLFVNDNTGQKYFCSSGNTSQYTDRYNKFNIEVKSSPNWLNGQVDLDDYGFYHYYVYERANTTGLVYNTLVAADIRDLVPTYFTGLVETGKMKYVPPDSENDIYADTRSAVKSYGQ